LLHPDAADLMTRKDSEKDSERPHYYSQFWLDVAAGRRVIGAPKTGDENEPVEAEPAEPALARRPGRAQEEQVRANADGRVENIARPVAEPVTAPEDYIEPEAEPEVAFSSDSDELELQDVEDDDIPDMDLGPADEVLEEEEEPEDDFYDEEEEEEEEESPWGSRTRKKPKPTRPTRQPKKPGRRDTRRGY
jgi:hypothetical protein